MGPPGGPHLLVGHSSGALAVQAFAYRYPAECAAAVLVDGAHTRSPRVVPRRGWVLGRVLGRVLVRTGPVRWSAPVARRVGVRAMSVTGRDPLDAAGRRRHYGDRTALLALLEAWFGHAPLQAGVVADQAHGPPPVPVLLLVGPARLGRCGPDRRWVAVQRDLATRLGAPEPVLLADAAHLVPLDRPDAVAAAIVAASRAGSPGRP